MFGKGVKSNSMSKQTRIYILKRLNAQTRAQTRAARLRGQNIGYGLTFLYHNKEEINLRINPKFQAI